MTHPSGSETSRVLAVLGPTNTGKTHYAVERMLGHASGMMGFPLRLLAREIYDKVADIVGASRVALITGEEKIVPQRPAYWICTVESMPLGESVDFMGVDEVQLAADRQRGHIFTDRLLHARGREETILMGAETMRPLIERLLPEAQILRRTRFSQLSYVEPSKLNRLPRRSALIGFSAETVYGLAELVRRSRGGAAVVMGALSPRTRNAQVEMYQNGDVDYLVATDAIGMGLNMDIDHVAFAETAKFDGEVTRGLDAAEVAQIAGRAGRHMNDGTFSTIAGEAGGQLDPAIVSRVEDHDFRPLKSLKWRNARLDYRSLGRLIAALEADSGRDDLVRMREAQDLQVLKALSQDHEITDIARAPDAIQRLWEVCQLPDFRKVSESAHIGLVRRIYLALMSSERVIPHDWMAREVSRLDNTQGDIDTLASRIASVRTWTYIANRQTWLSDAAHWADVTRGVEDKLSDALHDRLTQRFVDRRTSVLMRQLRQRGDLSVSIDEGNEVHVEGHYLGRIEGFSFHPDRSASGSEFKTLSTAADKALKAETARRAKVFANIGYQTLELDFSQGMHCPRLLWQKAPIAVIEAGDALYEPKVRLKSGSLLSDVQAETVRKACQDWLDARMRDKLEPLMRLKDELDGTVSPPEGAAPLEGLVRGVAFQLLEHFGVLPRKLVARELKQLDQPARKGLRRFSTRIGATALYMPAVLKPHAVELRLMLWALANGVSELPELPKPGLVTIETDPKAPREFYEIAGFRLIGNHEAVRLDMLERLADTVRPLGRDGAVFTVTPEIMGLVGCSGERFARVMRGLGYAHESHMVSPHARDRRATEQVAAVYGGTAREAGSIRGEAGAWQGLPRPGLRRTERIETPVDLRPGTLRAIPSDSMRPAVSAPQPQAAESTDAAVAAETSASPEADVSETDGTAGESKMPPGGERKALVEELRFYWAPKPPRGGKPKPKANAKAESVARGKPPPGKAKRRKAAGKPPPKSGKTEQEKKAPQPARGEVAVNEDSPFAQLKQLKEELERRQ